jgi:hypothetical protein
MAWLNTKLCVCFLLLFVAGVAVGPQAGSAAAPGSESGTGSGSGGSPLVSVTTCRGVAGHPPDPVDPSDAFSPDTVEIHAVAVVNNDKPGTKVSAVWIAVDAAETPNFKFGEKETVLENIGIYHVHFSYQKPDKGMPVGNYKLEIHIDGHLAGTAPFKVQSAAAAAPELVSITTCRGVEERTKKPLDHTVTFSADTRVIHAVAMVKSDKPGTKVTGAWISIDAGTTPNHKFLENGAVLPKEGTFPIDFTMTNQKNLPAGNYKVEVYIDGKLAGTAPFSVK